MSPRDSHIAGIIVGRKHTGKSTKLAGYAKKYNGRVLIMDVNMSPAYAGIKTIKPEQIKHWIGKTGVAKIVGTPTDETLDMVAENFRDGLVIFEDCTKYIPANIPPKIKAFLVDHRMWRVDLIFTFHSFTRVAPQFWEMISYVEILKTQDNVESARNKQVIPNYDAVLAAAKEVAAHKSEYFSKTVETLI